jgi:hypothetical protein
MVCQEAEREGIQLTVQDVRKEFLLKYVGGTTYMMRQQQLSSLVYGKGKCLDVISTQTEFERLSSSLFPGASLNPYADQLLAMAFADVYKRGDFQLWEKAVEMGPVTLDEWKTAIQEASIIRQTVVEGRRAIQRTVTRSSAPSRFQSSALRVHQMDVGETHEEKERQEGEGEVPKEGSLSMNKVGGKNPTSNSKPKEGRKRFFSWVLLQKFKKRGQCFHCYKIGHVSGDCPDSSLPGREPTEEEKNL